jgi:hypothetical protein
MRLALWLNKTNKIITIPSLWLFLYIEPLLQGSKWFRWKVRSPRESGTENLAWHKWF